MYVLQTLGILDIRSEEGATVGSIIAQPKRAAVLCYLAAARPGTWQTRDRILGVFWPERDEDHARNALNQTVFFLRRSLGNDALLSRADELMVNCERVRCDAVELDASLKRGALERVLELYQGDFLQDFYIAEAPEFEHWLDRERTRLREPVLEAAAELCRRRETAGDLEAAIAYARRGSAIAPYNEELTGRLVKLLHQNSEAVQALAVYDAFAERLRVDLELEPSPELTAIVAEIRATPDPVAAAETLPNETQSAAAVVEAFVPVPVRHPASESLSAEAGSVAWRIGYTRSAILAAVLLLAGLLTKALLVGSRQPEPYPYPRTAIAVLPLQDLSTDSTHAYFARGLHEELLTQLSKVADLSIRGRASVLGYAGSSKSAQEIAAELRVGTLVFATMQVVGTRLRVNVQLFDAATDENLWAESYDRTLEDVFGIQSDIAARIAMEAGATLKPVEREAIATAPTSNPDAYRLYLQGLSYDQIPYRQRQHLEAAQRLYEQAVALDSAFALAWAALSMVHGYMIWWRYDASPHRRERQRAAAQMALRHAPTLPMARRANGFSRYLGRPGRREFTWVLEEYQLAARGALENSEMLYALGTVHRRMGNWDEMVAAFEKAAIVDPRNITVYIDLGFAYGLVRRYENAVRAYDAALALVPDAALPAVLRGWTYVHWYGVVDTFRTALMRVPEDADLAGVGKAASQRALLHLLQRNADSVFATLRSETSGVFDALWFFLPTALYSGWAHQMSGRGDLARAAFDSARLFLDSAVVQMGEDWRVQAARGLAYAGLGRKAEAMRHAEWLAESVEYREDALLGPSVREFRALILAQVGEVEAALDEVAHLLAGQSFFLSASTLHLDPRWDTAREHPRFVALVRKYAGS